MSKVKPVLDKLFDGVSFDSSLYKKIVHNNIEFITRTTEHKHLFGSRLIGNHKLAYTKYDKNIFYEDLFGMDVETVISAITEITSIPKNFKIARDDINLVCFYIAHRFLSNDTLSKDKRLEYAKEILHYFNYRTLVLISSDWFTYPISEEKAISLSERLSNKYMIKRLKNWNEYCQYRSSEYIDSKYLSLLITFNKDLELPNAINDLYNRTKDMMKNIYQEFIDMLENDDIIKSRKNVSTDMEGKEVIADRTESFGLYIAKVENTLSDKNNFIKREYIDVTVSVVNTVSYSQLEETLQCIYEYSHKDNTSGKEVNTFIHDYLVNCFEFLQQNELYIGTGANLLKVISAITGNVLYARGTDVNITKLKEDGEKLLKKAYKSAKIPITDRNLKSVRNGFCIYLTILALF